MRRQAAAGLALATTLSGGTAAAVVARTPPADSAQIYHRAERLINHDRLTVPWDGRYFAEEDGTFCVEGFNGSRRDMRWRGHGLPPGFYLEVCSNGSWQVADGRPVRGLQAY